MKRRRLQALKLARRLLVFEAAAAGLSARDVAFADLDLLTNKLRPLLATLVGTGGTRALYGRALALASSQTAWLSEVSVNAEGQFEGLNRDGAHADPADQLQAKVVLVAELLGLLVTFVGPNLTSRLLGELWPQIAARRRSLFEEE